MQSPANPTLKSKEPTIHVVLYALKLTFFYKAFEITADVPEIYMQEFWVTASRHHSSLRFKMNGKSHTINVDNFRDMLKICTKLLGQKFEDPPLEEEILSFIRDLGHTGEIKFLSDVNVNHMHQPWRSFVGIINKCLSGKTTALESLRLSHAQILWGMYDNKNVDYVYLPWEDLVFQLENKNFKKNNDMYYPRFTKVIIDYFMAKDQAIPRRNKMFWHTARDNPMFTTMRVISKHQDTQIYGKRIKTSTKVAKPVKKKQQSTTSNEKGLNMLSEVALSEAEQIKLATKRSLIQTHSSHASGSGVEEGTGVILGVPDVPTYNSDDEQISWKSSDEDDDDEVNNDDNANNEGDDDQDDDNEQTESDNDDATLFNPSCLLMMKKKDKMKKIKKKNGLMMKHMMTKLKESMDVNVNLEVRDTKMTDAPQTNIQSTQVTKDTHVIITAATPEESTSLVDVPVSTNVEMPPSSVTPLPLPPIPFIQPQQQTLVPTPTIVPSTSLQNLPTIGSLFKFKDRVKALEDDFSEFKQSNQFAAAVSSIPCIVDTYLANKMNEAIKTVVQIQSDRLRKEAQANNEEFINTLDENMRKIINVDRNNA
ncbi:hypothetical protein Tco_0394512 [Tanacetum coccineum]